MKIFRNLKINILTLEEERNKWRRLSFKTEYKKLSYHLPVLEKCLKISLQFWQQKKAMK